MALYSPGGGPVVPVPIQGFKPQGLIYDETGWNEKATATVKQQPKREQWVPSKEQLFLFEMASLTRNILSVDQIDKHKKRIKKNLLMLRLNCFGELDLRRINEWEHILFGGDHEVSHRLNLIGKILVENTKYAAEMRAVAPFSGVVPQEVWDQKVRKLRHIGEYAGRKNEFRLADFLKVGNPLSPPAPGQMYTMTLSTGTTTNFPINTNVITTNSTTSAATVQINSAAVVSNAVRNGTVYRANGNLYLKSNATSDLPF